MKRLLQFSIIITIFVFGFTSLLPGQQGGRAVQSEVSPVMDVFAAPTVTGFSPSSGSGGTLVTISGTNLTGATAVSINGVSVTSFSVVSATQITATVSDNATTGKISVTASGTATSNSDFTIYPRIDSFTPSSAPKAAKIIISGGNFSGVTSVKFNGVSASFTKNSATQITATVPTRARTGAITLTTSSSSTTSTSTFTLLSPPVVSRFTPTRGAAGAAVTIAGSNFDDATSVLFNGVPATFSIVSATQITTTVPTNATKGKITVTTPGGTDASGSSFTVLPGIISFSPENGIAGTSVTISGTGLTGARSVKFDGVTATFTVNSDTMITATVPARATSGAITVTNSAGTATSGTYFGVLPQITNFSPSSGVIGATVTITGSSFTGATSIDFNGVSATFTVRSSTSIRASVPTGASTGAITVTTPAGSAISATDFTISGSSSGLSITSFSPVSGVVGSTVIIRGTGFSGVTDVRFNGVSSSFSVSSTTQINAIVPATASSGQITIVTSSESVSSLNNFSVAPQLTSFSPSSGIVGSTVVLSGSGLVGTNSVKFNGVSAGFTVNSATQITATVPASASSGKITLTTPTGSATSATDFTVVGPPSVTGFTPTKGATGTTVTILGSNFDSPTVTFNGVAAAITVISASQISATVPAGATSGFINVTTANGSVNSASAFTVLPAIDAFTPSSGLAGTSVIITGSGFSGVSSVKFNGTSASFTVNSPTQITATVPSGATTGPISVATSSGSASTSTNFTVSVAVPSPTITSFTPSSGPVGTTVAITGSNLTGASIVQFNGVSATSFTVVSSTQITATVPAGASTGKISVTTAGGTATSATNYSVTAGPTISSFTPTSGTVGAIITLTGTNLSGVTAVQINGVTATFSIISATQISITVPSDASTGKITVTSSAGSVISTSSFSVTPQIMSFTPTSGASGTIVTITGSGFVGTTSVKFNGVSAAYTTNSANEITATVPAGSTTGKISVVTSSGTATSASNFSVNAPPTITSFTPSRGAAGSLVTIFGTNFNGTDVLFNGVNATFTIVSSTQITATVPSSATTGRITVSTGSGSVTSTGNFTVTPSLTSFSPTNGAIGSTVVITGSGFSGVTTVRFNGRSTTFTVDSPNQITTTVPSGASSGPVSVTTSFGTATGTNFSVTPTLSSFSPTSGTIGNTVFLTGSAFNNVSSVELNGVAVTYSVLSSTSIRVTIPIGATSGIFTVTTADGIASSTASYTVISPIAISGFSPACAEIGNQVVVTGTSFIGVTEVLIDTSFCLFTVNSSTELVLTVPITATTGRIKIISANGAVQSATDFVPVNIPDVTSFSPVSGPVGTTVILAGTGFCTALSVDFNGVFATFTIDSDIQITTTVPYGATTGAITVINTVGSFTTGTDFTVTPDILSFTPSSGYVGDMVTITGTNFLGATDVSFNGTSAVTFTVDSYSQITAIVPVGATTGLITVTTPDGTDASPTPFSVLPKIDSFTPTTGIVGDLVTINGSGLNNASSVTFNGTSAGYTVISEAQIDAIVPFGATSGSIQVTTPVGTALSSSYFNVEPNITGFTPVNGVVGDNITIFGSAFTGATDVQFDGVSATFTVDSYSQITATVPPNASSGFITVVTTSGSDASATNFTVLPNIISFTPTSGVIGSSVNITGTTFTGATDVSFNSTSATYTIVSDVLITATVPSGGTTGPISVTTPDGTDYSSTNYTVLPDVATFTPTFGEVGDAVTIDGSGFTGATNVQFNGVNASFTVNSDIEISATVPNLATTGVITVITPSGTNSSTSSFTVQPTIISFSPSSGIPGTSVIISGYAFTGATSVAFDGTNASFTVNSYSQITATVPAGATTGTITVTTAGGTAVSATSFTLVPNITSFSPTSGVIGDVVTILGTNFSGATDVTFNGTSSTYTVVSATQIDATVPAGATTGLIGVTTPDGTDNSSTNFTVLPDVASLTPATGEVGDVITINGSGFTGATSVQFNGVSASYVINSSTDISATVPNTATTGVVSVTTPSGTNSSSSNFTVQATILSFLPTSGIPGTSVVITGYAFTGATAVAFNGVNASFTVDSYSQITATVPATATTGTITVTTAAGVATSATNFTLDPNITSFSPTSGIIGDVISIFGTSFTGATDVSFDGTSSIAFTVVSATQIDATVPVGATTGLISVTTPDGTDFSSTNFSVIPEITTFSPSTEQVGQIVVISGTSFTGATSVTFNGTSSSYTVDNDGQITATVPAGTTDGVIVVTTPSGFGTSSTSFGIEPDVLGFSPASGLAGASITITGTGFDGVTQVLFNGVNAVYTVDSYTQITATVPASASAGPIVVTNGNGSDASGTNFLVPPTITGLSAASGVIGSTVSITGTTFTGVTDVAFNGVSAVSYTVVSTTQIDATVPAGATTGAVTVTTGGGMATSASNFTVLPNVISFTNSPGPVGTSVVITGTAFTGASSVTFNGVASSYTVNSSTQITATVPSGATTGSIAVTTAAGTSTSATNFVVTPSVTSFTPTSGAIGSSVTINGQAFTGVTTVTFNGVSASFTFVSNTQITATVPAGATTGAIAVTTPSGTGTSGTNYSVVPGISGFSPSSGVIGSTVTITGTAFTGATAVTFNGVSAVAFTVVSSTQIDATVPAGATTGLINVTTPSGSTNSSTSYTVLPNITSFTNSPNPVGTSVVISGTAFTGATSVTFGGVASSYTVNSSVQITATVPAGANTGAIAVTTPAGTATSATNFVVTPSISGFTPSSGADGATVTINGQAFTGVTSVTFNGTSASFTFVSNTQVTATVPAAATTGTIAVTTPSGTGTSGSNFSVTPTIGSFSPSSGVIGSVVTITGTKFTGATAVTFNGVSAVSYTVVSATQIDATVPAGATTGLISVTTPSGSVNSSTSFTVLPNITSFTNSPGPVGTSVVISGTAFTAASSVTFNGVSASYTVNSSVQITATVPSGATTGAIAVTTAAGTATSATNYVVTPSISGFTPSSGAVGATVTINGQAFAGATSVTFNGTSASFTIVSNTQITATVPAAATTGTIAVTTPSGTGTSGSNFSVTPTVASFTPASGVIGSVVTINGTKFTGATAVTFNGVSAVSFTVVSATQIDATVPAGATTGLIAVTTPSGSVSSSTNFTVLPNITSFTNSPGPVGTSVVISGTAFTGASAVTFNGTAASYTVNSSVQITATVPSGATTGAIAVTTSAGTATSATNYVVTPTVSSFSPTSGAVGASITINGQAFTGATSVTFNGTAAVFTVVSNTQITATVPAAATTGTIAVTTPSGTGTSGSNFSVLPAISSFSPANGVIGSSVTINGTTFTGATAVRVNGVNAASFTVVSSIQIDFTVGAGSTTGLVSVITPAGTASSSTNYTVLPNITGFSASSGVVGTAITINGSAFTGATAVKFNNVNAAFSVVTSTSISTTVPSGATTGFVTVTTPSGIATSAGMFTVPPTITSFGPGSGFVADSITITGEGFTGATSVEFNGTSAGFLVYSATSIKAAVPAGATDGTIDVTTPSGSATSAASFDVLPKIAVLDELNIMLVVDSKGFEQRLFFGKVPDANVALANKFNLRPVQKGIFDVRFLSESKESNGRLVELFSKSMKNTIMTRVKIEAASYPLTIHFERGKKQLSLIRVSSLVDGKATSVIELTKNNSFTIEDANASELLIEIGEDISLPTEFALQQNYPNPFNPATTIQYALPGTYWVSLKVYNMLGEEVADLVHEQKDQGSYNANWNASNLSTGVYIYRLTAYDASNRSKQAFTQVKKMLFIK